MKRFNVQKELSNLEKRKGHSTNRKNLMGMIVPFFIVGFSFMALGVASYSLDNGNEEVKLEEAVIVEEKEEIVEDKNTSRYFYNNEDRYLKYNDMIFRILYISGDGTFRLMLNNDINRDYSLSIQDNLTNWFNMYFINDSNILVKEYDNKVYSNVDEVDTLLCNGECNLSNVGLISYSEYKLIYQYDENSSFFLNNYDINGNRLCNSNGIVVSCNEYEYYGIRPVINIKINKIIGEGTIDNPYMIEE